jgi:ribose transport system permease protein
MKIRTTGKNIIKNTWENLVKNYIMVFAVIILFFILAMVSNTFLSEINLFNVLRQMSMVAILAVGSFFVLAGGGVDISVGSLVGLTSVVVAASLSNWNLSPFIAIILALSVGAVFGLINGLLIACIGVPPLIGTLGTMEIGRGLLYVFTNGYAIPIKITAISFIGKGYL